MENLMPKHSCYVFGPWGACLEVASNKGSLSMGESAYHPFQIHFTHEMTIFKVVRRITVTAIRGLSN